jgi:hypothetical protein
MVSPCLPWRKLLSPAGPALPTERLALASGPGVWRPIGPERAVERVGPSGDRWRVGQAVESRQQDYQDRGEGIERTGWGKWPLSQIKAFPCVAHALSVSPMIRIAITAEAFEAIAATLPLGSVGFEAEPDAEGRRFVWLDCATVNKLTGLRGPSEGYSDAIFRIAAAQRAG